MPTDPIVRIETERLVLEPLRVEDADEMVGVLADESLYAYTGGSGPTLDALRRRYRAQLRGPAANDELWLNWIIRRTTDGTALGYVQATVIDDNADVAWVVGVKHQGGGVATEAAWAMTRWLVDGDVRQISAHIHPDHIASGRVARAVGLVATGRFDDDGEELWTTALLRL